MNESHKDTRIDLGGGHTFFQPGGTDEQGAVRRFEEAETDNDIVDAVLAAVYNCEIGFAGDILLQAFDRVTGSARVSLAVVAQTFLSMNQTDYRVNDLISEMEKTSADQPEMAELIEGAKEYGKMFAGSSLATD